MSVLKSPRIPQSEYQRATFDDISIAPPKLRTETVRYWSDYNRILYHPRSMIQINDYDLNPSLLPFERWETGEELFSNMDQEVDLLDRDLRPWAEECDALQGIQVICGGDDAWGGFAAKYVERVRDEFGKMALWVWAEETGMRVCLWWMIYHDRRWRIPLLTVLRDRTPGPSNN